MHDDRFHLRLLDALDQVVIATTPDATITYCNRAAERGFGWKLEQVLGRNLIDLLPTEDFAEEAARIRDLAGSGKPWGGRFVARGPDGQPFPFHVQITPVHDDEGGVAGCVGIATDGPRLAELEAALRESEDRFEHVFQASPDAIAITRLRDGLYLETNDAFTAISGWVREEVVGRSTTDRTVWADPADRSQLLEALTRDGKVDGMEIRYRHREGQESWASISARTIEFGGEPCLLSVVRDIQERVDTQHALQREHDRAQAYLDIAGTVLVALDRDGRVTMLNRTGCELLGCSREEAVGSSWFDTFLPPRYRQATSEAFSALMSGHLEHVEHFENPVLTRSGDERLIAWHNSLLYDANGVVTGTLSSGEDITDRRRAEDALRASEERFRTVFEASPLATAYMDLEGTILACNREFLRLHALPDDPGAAVGRNSQEFVEPGDRARMPEALAALLENEGAGEPVAYRGLRCDGSTFEAEVSSAAERDHRGWPVAIISLIHDVTERVRQETLRIRAEEQLAERERLYRGLFEQAGDGITVMKGDDFVDCNESALRLFGRSREQFVGRTPGELSPQVQPDGRSSEEKARALVRATVEEGPQRFEWQHQRPDGELFMVEVSLSPVVIDGELHLQAMLRDITDRKQAEALQDAARGVSEKLGEDFFTGVVQSLTSTMHADIALVAVLADDTGQRARTLALMVDGEICETLEYDLAGTPCDQIVGRGACAFTRDVTESFPQDTMLADLGAESYVGVPLATPAGDVIGLIAAISRRPMGDASLALTVIQLFAGRTVAEIQRQRAESEVQKTTHQLRSLAEHLQRVREDEQRRLARELHDELGQMLTALKFNLAWLRDQPGCQGRARDRIESMTGTTDALLEQARRIASDLRPGLLDTLGLGAAAEWQVQVFEQRFGVPCELTTTPPDLVAEDAVSTALFRILQEALTNVARHADAATVEVSLEAQRDCVTLTVVDDGVGIGETDQNKQGSYGILGMRERLIPLGGELTIEARPGKGTAVMVVVPLGEEGTL